MKECNSNQYNSTLGEHTRTHSQETYQRASVSISPDEDDTPDGPTNDYVLGIAFYSFLGFTIVQTSYAIKAKSSAMVADSSAMFVDAGTYLCNLYAEGQKNRPLTEQELLLPECIRNHKRKLRRLYFEIVPPFFSVCTLLYVTCTTLRDSLDTLAGHYDDTDNSEPDLNVMIFFSSVNLILDLVNVTCFARVNQAVMTPPNFNVDMESADENSPLLDGKMDLVTDITTETQETSLGMEDEIEEKELLNLNMCSAWTVRLYDVLFVERDLFLYRNSFFRHRFTCSTSLQIH